METLEFTHEELNVLRDVLERGIHDLNFEVLHTDSHDFKGVLKARKIVMESMLRKVSEAAVPA
jgi:hypothetical protein